MVLCPEFNAIAIEREEIWLHPFLINQYDVKSQNWSISQDPESHLVFLANSRGLIEYNGIRWHRYSLREDIPLRSVNVHPSGKIFTGSFEEFGFWERDEKHELVYHSLTHLTEIPKNEEIWRIYFNENEVYFQSFTSVYVYDFSTVRKITAPWTLFFLHQVNELHNAQVLQHGLYRFTDDGFEFIDNSELFREKRARAILPLGKDQVMICTHKDGIYMYDGTAFTYFDTEASEFLKIYTCNNVKQLADNKYVFGSILNGIIITDEKGNIQQSYNTNNGLNNNTVLSLYHDNDNGLWVGLDEGVNYIDLSSPCNHYKSRNGTFGTIYALLKVNNSLYIGTNNGLFKTEIVKKSRFFYFTGLKFINGSQGQVWALIQAGDQVLCGHNEGTFLVQNDQMEKVSEVTGSWNYQFLDDYMISGTYTGIIFLDRDQSGKWKFRNKVAGFNEPTRYLETDYLGYIWASHHQRGVFQIELSDDLQSVNRIRHFKEINDRSFNIRVFKVNNRVVLTTTENIYTFDFVRNEIIPLTKLADDLGEYNVSYQIQHHKKNQYRIGELDPNWQKTTDDHFTLRNLKHGKYSLEIRSDRGAVITAGLQIMKPWYHSQLAIIVYIILFILITWGLYLFFRFEISRHKELVSLEIKHNTLLSELDYKSHELMLSMRQLIRKDEILSDLQKQINAIREQSSKYPIKHINNLERIKTRDLAAIMQNGKKLKLGKKENLVEFLIGLNWEEGQPE